VNRFHDGEPVLAKGVKYGVDGVGVEREAGGNLDRIPTVGIEQEDLSPAPLSCRGVVGLENLLELSDLGGTGFADGQRARHEGTSGQAVGEVPRF
jgi:hypothetical protein